MEKAFEIKRFDGTSERWKLQKKNRWASCSSTACRAQYNAGPRIVARPLTDLAVNDPASHPLPSAPLKNRLLCMVYEAMLLFGVLFIATWLFSTLLQQRHALYLRDALQDWLFVVLGLYFCWFWTHGGQTLAMKTWHLRVVDRDGTPLSWKRAVIRYALCWLWFLPGLALAKLSGAQGWMLVMLPAANFVLWALSSRLNADRQFLHDRIARTRIVLAPRTQKSDASVVSVLATTDKD